MKLLKKDNTYKYYEISDKNSDDACYYKSDVVAIEIKELKYRTPLDCLMDGDVLACEYDFRKVKGTCFDEFEIIPETIVIVED